MKLQFSVSTLLLFTAAIAIAVTGIQTWALIFPHNDRSPIERITWCLGLAVELLPVWLPFAFATYAIARRTLSLRMILVFALVEAGGVGIAYYMYHYHFVN